MKKNIGEFSPHIAILLRGFLFFVSLTFVMALFPAMAFSEKVTLAWDSNEESDLKGYILYYGTASGNYSSNIDVGINTQYTTPDLPDGVTYYFAVTAYNDADFESSYSKELSHTIGASNDSPTTPATPNSPSSGYIDTSYTFKTSASDPNGDPIEYQFDWGDGTNSSWGAASRNHKWLVAGNYCIKARARDSQGALSAWSDCHYIAIATKTYSITATAGSHGSISPEGVITVNKGSNKRFDFRPDQNYKVAVVYVDGKSQGAVNSYRFTNVTQNHTITASFISKDLVEDSDGDGVPDDRDDFPYDADEYVDTDGDGVGNNADTDDDNDGMLDDWELTYGLNPLEDDAGIDPDGNDVSNIDEYNLGSAPNHSEGNFKPETPVLLGPENGASVTLTPVLETGDFDDPNVNDEHSKTQWVVMRAYDDVCVYDVTSDASLTALDMPNHVLEEDTEYIWKARFIDNHNMPSDWSEEREFVSGYADHDSDKNGVPDDQEVGDTVDLDEDGTVDIVQTDIKCVSFQEVDDEIQICISIKDADNAESIVSLNVQDPADPDLNSVADGKPNYFEFGMLDFKILVRNPGDETTLTIHLSKAAFEQGNCFKYDPVNKTWLDYSGYTEFSPDRKKVLLTLRDRGFGDADGIENGIIVDPLAFGSETDPSGGGGSDSPVESVLDSLLPDDLSFFIAAAAPRLDSRQSPGFWRNIPTLGLSILFAAMLLVFIAGAIVQNRKSKFI